jgi:hypothetical protein
VARVIRLPIADCRLPIVDCRLSIVDCRLSIADCRLPIVDCRLSIADRHLPFERLTSTSAISISQIGNRQLAIGNQQFPQSVDKNSRTKYKVLTYA